MDGAFLEPRMPSFLEGSAREDEHLVLIRKAVDRAGLPRVTPEAGRALQVLVGLARVERGVEVGTCLGYSTLWIARGLAPGGRLETLDLDPARSEAAAQALKAAGVSRRVRFLVADAHDDLRRRKAKSLDFLFLDADKEGMPSYLEEAARLLRKGGLLAADNVFWQGTALDTRDRSPAAQAVRAFNRRVLADERFDAAILPLGDGLLVARRR